MIACEPKWTVKKVRGQLTIFQHSRTFKHAHVNRIVPMDATVAQIQFARTLETKKQCLCSLKIVNRLKNHLYLLGSTVRFKYSFRDWDFRLRICRKQPWLWIWNGKSSVLFLYSHIIWKFLCSWRKQSKWTTGNSKKSLWKIIFYLDESSWRL